MELSQFFNTGNLFRTNQFAQGNLHACNLGVQRFGDLVAIQSGLGV